MTTFWRSFRRSLWAAFKALWPFYCGVDAATQISRAEWGLAITAGIAGIICSMLLYWDLVDPGYSINVNRGRVTIDAETT